MIVNYLLEFIKRNQTEKRAIRYSELKKFANLKKKGNPLAYTVITAKKCCISYSITSILPGFMTKGHVHKKTCPEIYILFKGKAQLVLKGRKTKMINMRRGIIYFINGKRWHRTINKGKENAQFISIYPNNAGHVYSKGIK